MQRRKFSREFKVEAVKLVRERGVSAAQAARDLDVHENVLRKWVKEFMITKISSDSTLRVL
jgi:transposase